MGPRFDTSYLGVIIHEAAKFNLFLKYLVFSEKDSHSFMKLKQFDQLYLIIYKILSQIWEKRTFSHKQTLGDVKTERSV